VGKQASGNAFEARGKWYTRTPIGSGQRPCSAMPWCTEETAARERARVVAVLALELRRASTDVELVRRIVDKAAAAPTPAELDHVRTLVGRIASGQSKPLARPVAGSTFGDVAKAWTSGDLAKRHPDHVRAKRSARDDAQRLRDHVLPLVAGVAMSAFTLDHAEQVMQSLDPSLAPATRRAVAQVMNRVVNLAIYPLKLVAANPLPRGWMPRIPKGAQRKQEVPHPDELDRFVGSEAAPLLVRLFVGFVAREGMRHEEAEGLTWADVDLDRKIVRLDENKTDEARSWALRPDTARALAHWFELSGKPARTSPIFTANGRTLSIRADVYREHLAAAGVTRTELHEGSTVTKPTGLHALRALFVTESLARGVSESWVTDRTGHRSSQMVAVYKRRARSWGEANLAPLGPLDVVLGWASSTSEAPLDDQATGAPEQPTPSRGRATLKWKRPVNTERRRLRALAGALLIRRSRVRVPVDPPLETRGFVNEARESREAAGRGETSTAGRGA
jgi:integrase